MVLYTPSHCLPYFEETDSICLNTGSLCEPSTLWCDLVALVDAKLNAFDETVTESISSFPYAQIAITSLPYLVDSEGSSAVSKIAVWDAVIGDSDNIVDLASDPSTLFLRRSGIWSVRSAVTWRSSLSATRMTLTLATPGVPKIPTTTFTSFDRIWVEPVPDPGPLVGGSRGLTNVFELFIPVDVSTGPVPINMIFNGFASNAFILTIEEALMSVHWVAELP